MLRLIIRVEILANRLLAKIRIAISQANERIGFTELADHLLTVWKQRDLLARGNKMRKGLLGDDSAMRFIPAKC